MKTLEVETSHCNIPLAIYMIAQQCRPNLVTHHHSHEEMDSYACTTHSCIHTRQTENRQTHVALKDPQKPSLSSAVRHVSASSASKHSRKGSMTHVRTYVHTHARLPRVHPRVGVHCPHRSHPSHGPSHALQAVGEGNCNYMCGAAGTVDCRVWAVVRTGSLTATGGRCP